MRICYLLLSPTFGMHQYTADYANRMAAAGHEAYLLTSTRYPADRYAPEVRVLAQVDTRDRGLSLNALQPRALRKVIAALRELRPDVVHITGPHVWNSLVMASLRRSNIPIVHSVHDWQPHPGAGYGRLLQLWNADIVRRADHVLVHSRLYLEQLVRDEVPDVTYLPLLHAFVGYAQADAFRNCADTAHRCEPPLVLFFGRLERYKGVGDLLKAWSLAQHGDAQLVVAGPGSIETLWEGVLPAGVDLRAHHIDDAEALDLFGCCAVVVLPYTGASQSALVGAAYHLRKPVIVTRSGALPEYVQDDVTGWVVEPSDPTGLARCLEQALADPVRLKRMGEAGRAWYDAQRTQEEQHLLQMYAPVATHTRRSFEPARSVGGN
ncbi:MAG: glycosyltransferase family 4 protein [Anaerolineae bacterium]